jgi:hypothetical protein
VYIHSLELPEIVTEIKNAAFYNYRSLRNVAFPPNAVISDNAVIDNNIIFGQRYNDMTEFKNGKGSEASIRLATSTQLSTISLIMREYCRDSMLVSWIRQAMIKIVWG